MRKDVVNRGLSIQIGEHGGKKPQNGVNNFLVPCGAKYLQQCFKHLDLAHKTASMEIYSKRSV